MIYLIDDEEFTIKFVREVLQEIGYQVESCSSGEEFLARSNVAETGCVIADRCLPGLKGTDIQEELVRRESNLSLIVISAVTDVATAVQMMKRGAITILQKPLAVDALLAAVKEGLVQSNLRHLITEQVAKIESRLAQLTESEMEVLKCLARGFSRKAISSKLELSPRSVDRRRRSLLEKMKVPSIEELISVLAESKLHREKFLS